MQSLVVQMLISVQAVLSPCDVAICFIVGLFWMRSLEDVFGGIYNKGSFILLAGTLGKMFLRMNFEGRICSEWNPCLRKMAFFLRKRAAVAAQQQVDLGL